LVLIYILTNGLRRLSCMDSLRKPQTTAKGTPEPSR
jgi:hypothetical protein